MTERDAETLAFEDSPDRVRFRFSERGNTVAFNRGVMLTVFPRGGRWHWCLNRRGRPGKEGETKFSPAGFASETECWRAAYAAAGWKVTESNETEPEGER